MRLGERKVISTCAATTPLLLLDDVWAELDNDRSERVLALVESEPGQVVVTGTDGNLPRVVRQWSRFEIHRGRVVRAQRRETDVV
jgi:recombinational DNA repair ATPase RecF